MVFNLADCERVIGSGFSEISPEVRTTDLLKIARSFGVVLMPRGEEAVSTWEETKMADAMQNRRKSQQHEGEDRQDESA